MAKKTLDSLAAEIERKIKAFEASGWENLERARDLGIDLIAAKDICVREELPWLEWLEEREIEFQRAAEWVYLSRNWDRVSALFPTLGNVGVRGVVKAKEYGTIPSKNDGYDTINCAVPVKVLFAAMGDCLRQQFGLSRKTD